MKNYFATDRSVTIDPNDLETINFNLGKIADASDACFAIANTLAFLQHNPLENNHSEPPYPGKATVDKILFNILGGVMQNRGAITSGLFSMIKIIAETLEDTRADIAVSIEQSTKEAQLKAMENVTV